MVLVHGLAGDSRSTWGDSFFFQLSAHARSSDMDIYSFGYGSLRRRAITPSMRLLELLKWIVRREDGREYEELRIVAHEYGAIVVRAALLEAIRSATKDGLEWARPWHADTKLFLFAPAHAGTPLFEGTSARNVLELFEFQSWGLLMALRAGALASEVFIKLGAIAIQDLNPDGPTLAALRRETDDLLNVNTRPFLVAAGVIHAGRDPLIHPTRFVEDPSPQILWQQGHWSVCRANSGFADPIDIVLA